MIDRTPPWAEEAEVSVLGACLIDPEAVGRATDLLTADMFYREGHRRVYRAMARIYGRGGAVDPTTVAEELRGADELEAAGGLPYLGELMDAVSTAQAVEYHAKIIEGRYRLRQLITAGSEIVRIAYDSDAADVDIVVDHAEQKVMAVSDSKRGKGIEPMKGYLGPVFGRLEEATKSGGGVTGAPTGFSDIDDKTNGLHDGDLIILAARPSMGKTALALQLALNTALNTGPVALFSLEMSKEQLVERMLAQEALVNLLDMGRGRLADDDFRRLSQAAGHLNGAPIWIDEDPVTALELRARARRAAKEADELALIVVDYLQLMAGSEGENRNQEIGHITRTLKEVGKELRCPVVALSQLSRRVEERSDKRPMLSDLRDSGNIEQDADLVCFLYRPEYYLRNEAEARDQGVAGYAELIIGKQRNGPTGTVELFFRKESTRFEAMTHQERG